MATRDITTTVENALSDNVIEPFFAIELLFDSGPLRLWTGIGEATIGGETYLGTGNLLSLSSIEETTELAVRGATVTLSGVGSEVISLALQSPYQGRVCNIYFGVLTEDDYSVGGTYPGLVLDFVAEYYDMSGETYLASLTQVFSGYMDEMNIEESPDTGTIELKVENKLVDLERARTRRYTSSYQKSVYPSDLGFDFVEDLQDKKVVWGRASG